MGFSVGFRAGCRFRVLALNVWTRQLSRDCVERGYKGPSTAFHVDLLWSVVSR